MEERPGIPANGVPVAEVVRNPPDPDQPPNPRLRQFLKLAAGGGLVASTVYTLGGGPSLFTHVLPATPPTSGAAALPWVRVSPNGMVNGRSTIANGGAEFGPDTPGTTTGGIQEAIESLRGVWGSVVFWGTIPIRSGLSLYPGIALKGGGPLSAGGLGESIIEPASSLTSPAITCLIDPIYADQYFPSLDNLTIYGGAGDGIRVDGIHGSIYDLYIHHVSVFNISGNGLNILSNNTSLKAWVDDVYFENCGQNGVLQNGGILRLNNAYIFNNQLKGVDANGMGILQMGPGSEVWNNGGGGIRVQGAGAGAIIEGVTFQDSGGPSLPTFQLSALSGANNIVLIKGCKFWESRPAASSVTNHIGVGTLPVRFLIEGNSFIGGSSGIAVNIPYHASNYGFIRNNPGYNDRLGYMTPNPVVGPSPWTYVNQDYVDLDFEFATSGGDTITGITKSGQPLPLVSNVNSGLIHVHPMESLVISYAHLAGSQTARRWGY